MGSTFSAKLFDPVKSPEKAFKKKKDATALICNAQTKRKVDLVLMSFGGNDIGFVPLLGHIIAGHDADVGRWAEKIFKVFFSPDRARGRLDMLASRFAAADRAIEKFLDVPQAERDRVLVTAYPPMLYDEKKDTCAGGFFRSNDEEDPRSDKRLLTPVAAGMDVHPLFLLNKSKAVEVQAFAESAADNGLYGRMKNTTGRHGWIFVDSYLATFKPHGMCAKAVLPATPTDEQKYAEETRLPRCRKNGDGQCPPAGWLPYNPIHFSAYASRQR